MEQIKETNVDCVICNRIYILIFKNKSHHFLFNLFFSPATQSNCRCYFRYRFRLTWSHPRERVPYQNLPAPDLDKVVPADRLPEAVDWISSSRPCRLSVPRSTSSDASGIYRSTPASIVHPPTRADPSFAFLDGTWCVPANLLSIIDWSLKRSEKRLKDERLKTSLGSFEIIAPFGFLPRKRSRTFSGLHCNCCRCSCTGSYCRSWTNLTRLHCSRSADDVASWSGDPSRSSSHHCSRMKTARPATEPEKNRSN